MLEVTRRLSCNPPGGQYAHPGLACRALRDMKRRLSHNHSACACALMIGVPAKAVGTIDGHEVEVPLDSCTACGLGQQAQSDLHILVPA
jgi:hypothetical protein